jgi:hypothetical protein
VDAADAVLSALITTSIAEMVIKTGTTTIPTAANTIGTIRVNSDGNSFIAISAAGGVASWRTLGIYVGDLSASAVANGSMYSYHPSGYYALYLRANGAWNKFATNEPA